MELSTSRSFNALAGAYFFELSCQLRKQQLRRSLYCAMCIIANVHLSGVFKTSDVLCGLCGATTAAMDVYDLWPREIESTKEKA